MGGCQADGKGEGGGAQPDQQPRLVVALAVHQAGSQQRQNAYAHIAPAGDGGEGASPFHGGANIVEIVHCANLKIWRGG